MSQQPPQTVYHAVPTSEEIPGRTSGVYNRKQRKYHVEHNARGCAQYVIDAENEQSEIEEEAIRNAIENEHKRETLNFCASQSTIEETYGYGIRFYFDFLLLVVLLNIILFLIQFGGYATNLIYRYKDLPAIFDKSNFRYAALLFSSFYHPDLIWVWRGINIACFVASILFVFVYAISSRRKVQNRKQANNDQIFLEDMKYDDTIEENIPYNLCSRAFRFIVSYMIALVLLVIQAAIVSGIAIVQNYAYITKSMKSSLKVEGFWNTVIMFAFSTAISIVISIMNSIFDAICDKLTQFEKHHSWTHFRNSNMVKLCLFKLTAVALMGAVGAFFATACLIDTLGNQFLTQILVDIFVNNIMEIVIPYIQFKIAARRAKGNIEDTRPEFNISFEYLEVIYRQYIIWVAAPHFPLITGLAVIASLLEFFVDRIRLMYICKKPFRTTESQVRTIVVIFLFVAILLALGNPAAGAIYSMIGTYWCNALSSGDTCKVCGVFEKKCLLYPQSCFVNIL